jgi:hypothetical protein
MADENPSNPGVKIAGVAVLALILLFPLVYGVVAYAVSAGGPDPFLEKPDPKYTSCVQDTTYMRLYHMYYLKEVKDRIVRQGIKGEKGIDDCWECHTSRATFCDRCHEAVNLDLNCFRCHYDPK